MDRLNYKKEIKNEKTTINNVTNFYNNGLC